MNALAVWFVMSFARSLFWRFFSNKTIFRLVCESLKMITIIQRFIIYNLNEKKNVRSSILHFDDEKQHTVKVSHV